MRSEETLDFDATLLMLSLIPSGIGFVLFMYGGKQHRWPQLACGLLLMVYPYFTASVGAMIGIWMVIGAGLYALLAAGW